MALILTGTMAILAPGLSFRNVLNHLGGGHRVRSTTLPLIADERRCLALSRAIIAGRTYRLRWKEPT
ncbi:MAG: hypothetical protein ACPLRR_06755 [Candidatus Saccharicenans sp.]